MCRGHGLGCGLVVRAGVIPPISEVTDAYVDLRTWCVRAGHGLGAKDHEADRWVAAVAIAGRLSLATEDSIFNEVPGCHRAWFAWRLGRLRRWRTILPEDASTGDAPHSAAKAESFRSRSGLSPRQEPLDPCDSRWRVALSASPGTAIGASPCHSSDRSSSRSWSDAAEIAMSVASRPEGLSSLCDGHRGVGGRSGRARGNHGCRRRPR